MSAEGRAVTIGDGTGGSHPPSFRGHCGQEEVYEPVFGRTCS